MSNPLLGKKGEAAAARYYLNRGYILVAHNFRCRLGELDLILQKDGVLVIAEVKTRSHVTAGTPAEAVTYAKRQRILNAAKYYISCTMESESSVRFDVVEVVPLPQGGYGVHCIFNAFDFG